jgi:hypothetical protein
MLTLAGLLSLAGVPASANDWLIPSSARWPGAGGAFFTTDVSLANLDARDVTVTLKFLRHDEDGSLGPERSYLLRAGEEFNVVDVLKNVFGFTLDWGAIRVSADTPLLAVTSQTSTNAGGGTYGQSVPGFPASTLVSLNQPGSIAGIRQNTGSRTNLVLANAINDQITVHGDLYGPDGAAFGQGRDWVLPPLGMTQATSVVEQIAGPGVSLDVGRLVLSTSRPGAPFAAYVAVIDDTTNDPRTLLPTTSPEPARKWIVPSVAHAPGAGGAFYTTDLTLANGGLTDVSATLRFLGHDQDGTLGPQRDVVVRAGATRRFQDVLGSLFGVTDGYGALLVTATSPDLNVVAETSTRGPGGGTYGQSVPAVPASSFARPGTRLWLGEIRDDASYRTNLVLANPTEVPVVVAVEIRSSSAALLGSGVWLLPPLGMTQVGRVVEALLGAGTPLSNGQLLLSTSTPGGAFATYASVIDNATNDPRTLLPR